jgi:TM2 domain-containing membrane protein YozV
MSESDDRDGQLDPPNDWAAASDDVAADGENPPKNLPSRGSRARRAPDQLPVPQQRVALDNQDIFAIVIGLFLPGVGQMILGQPKKGLVILIGSYATCGLGGILVFGAMIDAYLCAVASKVRALDVWEFFPNYKDLLK